MPPRKSWAKVLDKKAAVAAAGRGKGVVSPGPKLNTAQPVKQVVSAPPSKVDPSKNPHKKANADKSASEDAPSTFEKLSVGLQKIPAPYTGPARVLKIPTKITPVHTFSARPIIVGDAKKTLDEIRSNLLQHYSRLFDHSSNSLEDRLVHLTCQVPNYSLRPASDVAARLQDLRSTIQPPPSVAAPLKLNQMLLETRQRAQAANLYNSLERQIQIHDNRIKEMQSKLRLLSDSKR